MRFRSCQGLTRAGLLITCVAASLSWIPAAHAALLSFDDLDKVTFSTDSTSKRGPMTEGNLVPSLDANGIATGDGSQPKKFAFAASAIGITGTLAFLSLNDDDGFGFSPGTLGITANAPLVAPVPEPGTMSLMGLGLLSLLGAARRRRTQEQV